jgi:S1-C subfamily serine protease
VPWSFVFIDIIVIILALGAAARGWRRGLLGQAFEVGGGLAGLVVGVALGPLTASLVTDSAGLNAALLALVVVLAGLSLGQALGLALGHRFGLFARRARLGGADSSLGAGFGMAMTLVAYWLLGSLLLQGPIPPLSRQLSRSRILRELNSVTEPPDVVAYLQQYLNASRFPLVFPPGLPPAASGPVTLPPKGRARRAFVAAQGATMRVIVSGCGGTQLGSGWISSGHSVVTNAHVVAGATGVRLEDPARSYTGSVVLFDPETDLAVVRTEERLEGTALSLRRTLVGPGTQGVTLGYPGRAGGSLSWHPAAVRAHYAAARGFDIYGRNPARRDIYELRARVREGDSGGPFVLPGGKVAGVVFAASPTSANTGYALTAAEVSAEVERGSRSTRPVSPGRCPH